MEEKLERGRPRAFKNEDEFRDKFTAYAKYCEKKRRLPNVAGFCVFTDITRETYYKQKEYYSDTFKKVELALEDCALNASIAPAVKIFYLKNKFGDYYKDKQHVEHEGQAAITIVNDI